MKETYRQLDDKEVYEQVPDDPSVLANTLIKALEKIRLWRDLSKDTLDYFLVKDPKFARFYLLPKIHNDFMMYQEDQWFRIAVIIPKTYPHF